MRYKFSLLLFPFLAFFIQSLNRLQVASKKVN
jgi:hypothetical protein